MKKLKSLKEVCGIIGVTRRMVQSYEKAGLVSASGRNKYGYLQYGDADIERIRTIRQYQKFGFKLREIKELIDAPENLRKQALERQILVLQTQREELIGIIETAEILIQNLKKNEIGE